MGTLHELAAHKTVAAIGPGITRHEETANVVRVFLNSERLAIVLDADGSNAYEKRPKELTGDGRTLVLTPHPGEMSRLTGLTTQAVQRDRVEVASSFGREHKQMLVLKGVRTVVDEPDDARCVSPTEYPAVASGANTSS